MTCWLCSRPLSGRAKRWCSVRCRDDAYVNHRWSDARKEALRRWRQGGYRCARCGEPHTDPEVNHLTPCRGRHGRWGCWHHQENLEVLCHGCHVEVTNEQRGETPDWERTTCSLREVTS